MKGYITITPTTEAQRIALIKDKAKAEQQPYFTEPYNHNIERFIDKITDKFIKKYRHELNPNIVSIFYIQNNRVKELDEDLIYDYWIYKTKLDKIKIYLTNLLK